MLKELAIVMDDKIFLAFLLKENGFTKPLSVGQGTKENEDWEQVQIRCNLPIKSLDDKMKKELNDRLDAFIDPFKVRAGKDSKLYFTFYRPFGEGPVYRIEIKEELAADLGHLKKF